MMLHQAVYSIPAPRSFRGKLFVCTDVSLSMIKVISSDNCIVRPQAVTSWCSCSIAPAAWCHIQSLTHTPLCTKYSSLPFWSISALSFLSLIRAEQIEYRQPENYTLFNVACQLNTVNVFLCSLDQTLHNTVQLEQIILQYVSLRLDIGLFAVPVCLIACSHQL